MDTKRASSFYLRKMLFCLLAVARIHESVTAFQIQSPCQSPLFCCRRLVGSGIELTRVSHISNFSLGKRRNNNLMVLGEKNDRKIRSFSRAGGRSRKRKDDEKKIAIFSEEDASSVMSSILGSLKKALPLLLILAAIRSLLGFIFGGMNSNVVYYQSTVYEETRYDENGDVSRLRRESFQSNIPSMISDENLSRGGKRLRPDESVSYFETLDSELRRLDREVDNVYRSTISDDYF